MVQYSLLSLYDDSYNLMVYDLCMGLYINIFKMEQRQTNWDDVGFNAVDIITLLMVILFFGFLIWWEWLR